ncbi:MAG TPA: hypothetical protein VFB79_21430 [Candidatus Angelobacter sp.]|nr:hypothetical protein [Candidatus Angelobacter sp.]
MTVSQQIGLVTIKRRKGRIAGFGLPKIPVQILWCGTNRPRKKFGERKNGWSFPPAVRELLLQELAGKTCLHLFGGAADFGVRLDLDPATNPDVVGDAFLPPFARDSFDAVILDPPYYQMKQQEKMALMRAAAWISRDRIYWFHTVWIASDRHTPLQRAWLVRVGDQCAVRVLQEFKSLPSKLPPLQPHEFTRGHPLIYKRWAERKARGAELFPDLFAGKQIAGAVDRGKSGVYTGDWHE